MSAAAKMAREQTARSIAADAEGMRRPPIGRLTSKSVTAHRRRLAEACATAASVTTTDKSEGMAGVVRKLARKERDR